MVQIKEIDYGLGFCVNKNGRNYIELNKNLKKYPFLYNEVLTHELQHLKNKTIYDDFMLDFKDQFNSRKQFNLMVFSFRHPRAFLANSPVFFEKDGIGINWFMAFVWFVWIGIIIGGGLIL